jgi:hypothetical protein
MDDAARRGLGGLHDCDLDAGEVVALGLPDGPSRDRVLFAAGG